MLFVKNVRIVQEDGTQNGLGVFVAGEVCSRAEKVCGMLKAIFQILEFDIGYKGGLGDL